MNASVSGLRELDEALGDLTKSAAKGVLRRTGLKALQPVADAARAMAPDDPETGGNDLRNSIGVGTKLSRRQAGLAKRAVRMGGDDNFVEVYAGVPATAPQGAWQEFGTVNHGPQPFMRSAWDSNKDGVLNTVKTELASEIAKATQRAARKAARLAAKG
jgi:HK97 gp10 family phage protein